MPGRIQGEVSKEKEGFAHRGEYLFPDVWFAGRVMNISSISEFLKGKKTYLSALVGGLYLVGCLLKYWEFDEKILAAIGFSGLAFLRAGVEKGPGIGQVGLVGLIGLVGLMGSGCQTALKSDKIVSETSWVVGLRVKTSDATGANPLPDVQLGVMRQTITMIPTSTNGTITAPRFGSVYAGKQNAYDPISTDAQESVFSGDVMVSTNATGGAVVPKLGRP